MDTIDVYGSYKVRAGVTLTLNSGGRSPDAGFHVHQPSDNSQTILVNSGTVHVVPGQDSNSITGIDDPASTALKFVNDVGATFTVISSNSELLEASGDVDFINRGDVLIKSDPSTYWAFGIYGSGSRVDVTNSGMIQLSGYSAYFAQSWHDGSLVNSGTIVSEGMQTAAIMNVQGEGSIDNSGVLKALGGETAGAIFIGGGVDSFDNSGKIIAEVDHGSNPSTGFSFNATGVETTITNEGLIRAAIAIAERSGGTDAADATTFNNSGAIHGAVQLGLGNDTIDNTGLISGQVDLGDDNDLFQESGHGRLVGLVYGGSGDDHLAGGKFGDVLYGDNGPLLTDNGADALAGGRGDDQLHGDGGADTLIGGAGADTLEGGDGNDTFVFRSLTDSMPGKADLITDLQSGDVVDLSAIDANTAHHGNDAFALVAALDGHAGEAALVYDSGTGQTSLMLDVNGDGVADSTILITGDQHGFNNFVL